MLWPTLTEDGWAGNAVEALECGAVLLLGSPELDFVRDVDLRCGIRDKPDHGPMREARRILDVLDAEFETLGHASVATATPDRLDTRLRTYRRIRAPARRKGRLRRTGSRG